MRELVDTLNKHAYSYYVLDAPTVADGEYDALYDELVALERRTGVVLPDSPTLRVGGGTLKGFKKYVHKSRLYSLDKCKTKGELARFAEKIRAQYPEAAFTVEYKLDGLSINLFYEGGTLKTAATRGNGIIGEDVTAQIRTIKSLPLKINYNGACEIVGEVIMRKSALRDYNLKNPLDPLKNERNAAAGAVRNLDPRVTASRRLDVMAYGFENLDGGAELKTQEDIVGFLKNNGFLVAEYYKKTDNIEYLLECVDEIERERADLDYLIDGAVIKIDELAIRDELGYTEKFPRFAVAYKFEALEVTTVLKEVKWQVSRTGKLNPLAVLEPVELGGVTVSRATLSNVSEIKRKAIKINSRVFVRRSNDVIPEITGVAEDFADSVEVTPPLVCPSCGAPVEADAVFIYCSNRENCRDVIVSRLRHYASRDAMNIEGLSQKTLEIFYDKLGVVTPCDLYKLTARDLTDLEGFRDKKAENIAAAIKASLDADLADFIYALGIENVGKKAAKDLAARFRGLDALKAADESDISALGDFGGVTARCVCDFFKDGKNLKIIDGLLSLGLKLREPKGEAQRGGAFLGKTVVLTGTLDGFKRVRAKELIEENGGETADSVSARVNLVVAGGDAGSKLDKAKKLGIEIIDEAAFKKMIEDANG
jgi:DNA ligase (NAD+)